MVLQLWNCKRTTLRLYISLERLNFFTDLAREDQTPRPTLSQMSDIDHGSQPREISAKVDQTIPNIPSNVGDQTSATGTGMQPSTLSSMDYTPKHSEPANLRGGYGGHSWPICLCCCLYLCFCKECYDDCQDDCSDCCGCC